MPFAWYGVNVSCCAPAAGRGTRAVIRTPVSQRATLPPSSRRPSSRNEQRQVDGVRHQAVPRLIGMQVVPRVGGRQEARGPLGVPERRVEIDDRVEGATAPDPSVDGLPRRLALVAVVLGATERWDGPSVD